MGGGNVNLDWDEFDREFRELLSRYGPVEGTITPWDDDDDEAPAHGLTPPIMVEEFLAIAVFKDVEGNVYTGHFAPQGAIHIYLKGLAQQLRELYHDV